MAILRRPARPFSFGEHQLALTRETVPGNQLDAVLNDIIESVISTQEALREIRRDDGRLPAGSITRDQLSGDLLAQITQSFNEKTIVMMRGLQDVMTHARVNQRDIELLAKDAEAAAVSSAISLSASASAADRASTALSAAQLLAANVDTQTTEAENWGNYSRAQADNAEASEAFALAWAEYLAGPVVSGPEAPDFIAQSPYPHGLFYQPVDGGLAGLWSAKWWALYCQMLVGNLAMFYLGAWDHGPAPGEQNPQTGIVAHNPLKPGSFYFDTTEDTVKFWTGDRWLAPFSLTGGVTSRFNYKATAGQTVFTGADIFGQVPTFTNREQHDVHVNGVKLTRDDGTAKGDYTINDTTDTLTLLAGVTVNSIVQWDVLVAPDDLRPGAATIYKLQPLVPDGTTTVFTMQYSGPGGITNVNAVKAAEIIIVLDGVQQEPVTDYNASGATLTFVTAPPINSRLWGIYFKPGAP